VPDLKWNRRGAVAVGIVGLAICIYGLVRGSLSFTALGVIVMLFALFHRRLKSFLFRAGRFEASGELVADRGEGEATEPEPSDDSRPDQPQP
jgi:hypothetical protein